MTASLQAHPEDALDNYGDCDPIAIIAAACRFPHSQTAEAFWRNIADGVDLATEVDAAMLERCGMPASLLARKDFVPVASIVENADRFDAAFFGYSPQEAASIDPQQRIFLTLAWEALDSAGYAETVKGRNVGIFGAARVSTYQLPTRDNLLDAGAPRIFQRLIGNDKDYLATRIAFKLGLTGPALSVQTACSSSLVAVHVACEHIRNGECDMALAGGVGISFPQESGYFHHEGMIFSPDGRCRPYDASAQGTRIGNGAGIVLLKPLRDAIADADPILAVIRGSAVNNDGASKIGYTAPSVEGQAAVIREALGMAEIDPGTVGLVEGHGTATPLGDPVEVAALTRAYGENGRRQFCALGSVKSNIGHADTAAGIASLLKAVMALKHGQIPPSLHFQRPNPEIDFASSPFYVPQVLKPWLQEARHPRRAGVSSFGIGGTNCHVVLEAAPPAGAGSAPDFDAPPYVLAFSSHDLDALRHTALRYGADLADLPDADVRSIAATLIARPQAAYRLAVAGHDGCDLADVLEAFGAGREKGHPACLQTAPKKPHRTALVFTGQGSQEPGMGAALYKADEAFRIAYDRCAAALWHADGPDLVELMLSGSEMLGDPVIGQPALVAFEFAMAQSWLAAGLKPDALMGHSLGELAAAAVSGALTAGDAMRLALRRGELGAALPDKGAMAVLRTSRTEVEALIGMQGGARLAVAADNGPDNIAVSGAVDALREVMRLASARGISGQLLAMSSAFHSPLLDPLLDDFQAEAARITVHGPTIPVYSTVSGDILQSADAAHWRAHLRQEVRFAPTVRKMHADGFTAFIEVGPAATLSAMGPRCLDGAGLWLPSRRHQLDEMLQWRLARVAAFQAGLINVPLPASSDRRAALPPRCLNEQSYLALLPEIGAARDGEAAPADDATSKAADWEAATASGAARAEAGAADIDLSRIAREDAAVETLHAAYAGNALMALGCFSAPEERRTLGDILRTTPIKPKFRQLLQRLLRDLVEAGVLRREGKDYSGFAPVPLDAVRPLLAELRERGDTRLAGLIERGGEKLADMLAGRAEPVAVIFPAGSSDDVEDMYQNSDYSRYFNSIAADAVAAFLRGRKGAARILEVGGGTGGTTWDIVNALQDAPPRNYLFTDAGSLFLKRAQQKFGRFPFMAYTLFDMEKEPQDQGIEAGAFDVVVAANVLHNARDLRGVMARLYGVLRPGGMIVLREITQHKKLFDFVFGPLVPPLDDLDRRGGNLFASAGVWQEVAREAGFEDCAALPDMASAAARLGEQVLLFRKRGAAADVAAASSHPRQPDRGVAAEADSAAGLVRLMWRAAEEAGLPIRGQTDLAVANLQGRTALAVHADRRGIALTDSATGARLAWAKPVAAAALPQAELSEAAIADADGDGLDALFAALGTGAGGFHIQTLARRSGNASKLVAAGDGFAAVDARGKPVLICRGVSATARGAMQSPPPGEVTQHLYRTAWSRMPPAAAPGQEAEIVLIGDDGAWAEILGAAGAKVASHAATAAALSQAVPEALASGAAIVLAPAAHDGEEHPLACQERLIAPLASILRDIRSHPRTGAIRLAVLARGALAAEPLDEVPHPENAGMAGFLRVAANEYPEVAFQFLDVGEEADPGRDALQMLASGGTGRFALRNGEWLQERLERVARPFDPVGDRLAAQIAGDGWFVLIGGMSEMGLTLAGWLADEGARHIALLGRSGPTAEIGDAVAALQARGVTLCTVLADAGDPAGLEAALGEVVSGGAKVAAIFHLAGVVEDAPIAAHDEASFARVLRPKWLGALTCHRLETQLRPALTVYFSSATTVFGPAGQAAHATANALLEGLAAHRAAQGLRTVAVAWGFWADIRRQERQEMARRLADGGMLGLPTPLGLALLERAIAHPDCVLAALKADWAKVRALIPGQALPPHLAGLAADGAAAPADGAADEGDDPLAAVRTAPGGRRDAALRHYLKARIAELLQRDAASVAEEVNLIQLGLDSLMFLEFSHRLTSELGVSVTAETAFSLDTVAKLAAHIDAELPRSAPGVADAAGVLDAAIGERPERTASYLRARIAALVGVDAGTLPLDGNLIQLGLDSLMFLELSHTLSTELGVTVTAEAAFEFSTIGALADHIASLLDGGPQGESGESPAAAGRPAPGHVLRHALREAAARGLVRIDANGDLLPLGSAGPQDAPLPDAAAALHAARGRGHPWAGVEPRLYAEWDKADFDLARFETVWNRLVARHDMLRAVERDGGRMHVLQNVPHYAIAVKDLSALARPELESRLGALRREMSTAAIDAGRWPRFGLCASRLPDGVLRLHLDLDARLADVESFQILLREMAVLMGDPAMRLPPLAFSPLDYSAAIAAAQAEAALAPVRDRWRQALEARPGYPALPLAARARHADPRALFSLQRILPPGDWRAVKASAAGRKLTSTELVLALFAAAIAGRTEASPFALDLHYFNRLPLHAQVKNVLGDFSAAMPVAFDAPAGGGTVEALAALTQAAVARLRADGDISALSLQRDGIGLHDGPAVAFMTLLGIDADYALTETEDPVLGLPSFELTALPGAALSLQALEHERGLMLTLTAVRDYHADGVVEGVADDLLAALDALQHEEGWLRPPQMRGGSRAARLRSA